MKRLAVIFTIASGVLFVLGLIDYLTNYNWANDQDPLFGNQRVLLNDGATILIATGFLVLISALLWVLAVRKGRSDQQQS
jgi:hypothetical protein